MRTIYITQDQFDTLRDVEPSARLIMMREVICDGTKDEDQIFTRIEELREERKYHLAMDRKHPMDSSHSFRAMGNLLKIDALEWVLGNREPQPSIESEDY